MNATLLLVLLCVKHNVNCTYVTVSLLLTVAKWQWGGELWVETHVYLFCVSKFVVQINVMQNWTSVLDIYCTFKSCRSVFLNRIISNIQEASSFWLFLFLHVLKLCPKSHMCMLNEWRAKLFSSEPSPGAAPVSLKMFYYSGAAFTPFAGHLIKTTSLHCFGFAHTVVSALLWKRHGLELTGVNDSNLQDVVLCRFRQNREEFCTNSSCWKCVVFMFLYFATSFVGSGSETNSAYWIKLSFLLSLSHVCVSVHPQTKWISIHTHVSAPSSADDVEILLTYSGMCFFLWLLTNMRRCCF